ncbi:MAG: helix-turn-helix domain-containing protein [Alphaproteobacteria bacterium]
MQPIGALAKSSGCSVQTIRWYEQAGLLPPPHRTEGGRRLYNEKTAARLAFIRHARELGFSLDDIRELLAFTDNPEQTCSAADQIAHRHLAEIENRIARLSTLRTELKRMIKACIGGRIADCRVIEVLADHDHAKCLSPRHTDKSDHAFEMPTWK